MFLTWWKLFLPVFMLTVSVLSGVCVTICVAKSGSVSRLCPDDWWSHCNLQNTIFVNLTFYVNETLASMILIFPDFSEFPKSGRPVVMCRCLVFSVESHKDLKFKCKLCLLDQVDHFHTLHWIHLHRSICMSNKACRIVKWKPENRPGKSNLKWMR